MKIQELVDRRVQLIKEARKILEKADEEKRNLSAQEKETFDKAMAESEELKTRIDQAEELRKAEEHAKRQQDLLNLEQPPIVPPSTGSSLPPETRNAPAGRGSDEYRSALDGYFRRGINGLMPDELRALQVGTDSEGGYIVPTTMEASIVETLDQFNVMRRVCNVITTQSDRQIPVESSIGTAAWTAEEAAYTESDHVFTQVTLSAYKEGTIMKVSEELLQDAIFPLESYIAKGFGRRLGLLEEAAFVSGDGSSKPTGIDAGATAGTALAATTGSSITPEELMTNFHDLSPQYRTNAKWLMHDSTALVIRKIRERTELTPDGGGFIWQPGLQAGQPDRILGKEVLISQYADQFGASSRRVIVFGDFSYYWIADRGATVVQRLNELYAANGQVGFRAYRRTDGKLTLAAAAIYAATS